MTPFPLDAAAITSESHRMKSTRCNPGRCRWMLAACFLTAILPPPAAGQITSLKKLADASAPAQPAPPETPEEARDRLTQWLQDARDSLARLEAPEATTSLPEGISAEELADRRRDLEQMILTSSRSLKNISAVTDARKALEGSRNEDAAWTSFKENPPYSLLMVDELLNERDAIQVKLTSYESSLTNLEGLLVNILSSTKISEDNVSAKIVELQQATPATQEAAKWRLEAARTKSRQLAIRADGIKTSGESLRVRIADAKIELSLLERKIRIAKSNSRFNDEDLAKITKLSEARKLALRKEQDTLARRLKTAMATRAQAQDALDALGPTPPAGKPPEGLDLAKFRLEVAEGRVDTMQSLGEGLDGLIQLENIVWESYQNRRSLINATDPADRSKASDALVALLDRARAWEKVLENEMAGSSADLSKLESRAASISAEDPRFSLLNEQRATKSENFAMLQRFAQVVSAQRKLLQRWTADFADPSQKTDWFQRISSLGVTSRSALAKIWSFEVMSFEDKVEVEGRTITGSIPVTLGMLLRALSFFIIGYWIFARLAKRLQKSLVTRGHIADAQARTLRKWAMIVVGMFLAIATLSFLKIPLTVFAFFGGALAIGLGFGTQTLIKNFISGIIVLAERKVRVGDVLDVEGIIGTVIEINTRSSVIRSADDVETMIPNSLFLENRVTNWTLSTRRMRRSLRVGVAYGSSPQQVIEILTESTDRHGLICKEPAPFAVLEDFGESALVFQLYFWLELKGKTNPMIVTSDLRLMIEKRFVEADIRLPFPQRDVHLSADLPLQVEWAGKPAPQPDPYA
jgi:small-conductance mechanosensitive channel